MNEIPQSIIIHCQDPEKRRDILLRLKDAARKLTPFAHQQGSSTPVTNAITAGNSAAYIQRLDEHVSEAYELCSLIEVCLMNGIRIKEFQGVIPLWGLLERLVSVQRLIVSPKSKFGGQSFSSLQITVDAVARMTSLRTPVAKTRAWIRCALNLRALDECLCVVLEESKLVGLFYSPDAILSHPDNVIVLKAVLSTLKVLPFAFDLEDTSLNSAPSWTAAMLAAGGFRPVLSPPSDFPPVTGRSSNSNLRGQQKQGRGMFSSIFSSIAGGISGVLDSVDTMSHSRTYESDGKESRDRDREHLPPLTPLFGTSLRDLILDDRRCGVCHMDPYLGVPSMVICMISFLTSHVDTPGLFRQKVSFESSEELRMSLEYERGIPRQGAMSKEETVQMVHIVAFTLLQWFTELPEPLLGATHYSALEACQDVEEEGPRVRNFSLLVLEAPWYNQPLLSKVMSLLSVCLLEDHAVRNGLNLVAMSVLFTPFLFRRDPHLHHVREHPRAGGSFYSSLGDLHFVERDEEARSYLCIASAGSCTVEFMILREAEVLAPLRASLTQIRTALAAKVTRLRSLMDEVGIGASVTSLSCHWLEAAHKERDHENGVHHEHDPHMGLLDTNGVNIVNLKEDSAEKVEIVEIQVKNEGEERLFELAFSLYLALSTVQEARRNRLLTGEDASAVAAFRNTSESCPSNSIRIMIESKIEKELGKTSSNSAGDAISSKKKSAYSVYGGASVKDVRRAKEKESESFSSLEALYASSRWGICGFQALRPLHDFQSSGLLALKNLAEFLLRYEEAAGELGADFAQQRARYCTYAQVAVQLSKFTADALRLTPTPYTPLSAPIQHLAKQLSWHLLSEPNAFQELFNVSMLTFDEAWRAVTEERGTLPHAGTYEQCLMYVRETLDIIISACPRSLEAMWTHWLELMDQRRRVACSSFNPLSSSAPSSKKTSPKPAHAYTISAAKSSVEPSGSLLEAASKRAALKEGASTFPPPVPMIQGGDELPSPYTRDSSDGTASSDGTPSPFGLEQDADAHTSSLLGATRSGQLKAFYSPKATQGAEGVSSIFGDPYAEAPHALSTGELENRQQEALCVWTKSICGIDTKVIGGSHIFNSNHIAQLEAALPETSQCCDWRLLYRLGRDGASLNTLLLNSRPHSSLLLVLRDLKGAVFGGFITEQLKGGAVNFTSAAHPTGGGQGQGPDKYYGNGTVAVWSFVSGSLQYYSSANKNPYYLLSSPDSFAMGGGTDFALYLDGDLDKGSSGDCDTFQSPCLASSPQFVCAECELFGLESSTPY